MKVFLFNIICRAVIGLGIVALFVGSSGDADARCRRFRLFHRHCCEPVCQPCCEPAPPAPTPPPVQQAPKARKAKHRHK